MKIQELRVAIGLGMMGAIGFSLPALAQSNIVADPTAGTTVVPNFLGFPIEAIRDGAVRGQNLFHSFQEFNISPDRAAFFLIPNDTIQNVFARVTGQNLSQIDGVLGTRLDNTFAVSTANLFLLNPNGIIFGASAQLDVGGSFAATTANAIGFGDRGSFGATTPGNDLSLLTINPSVYLFDRVPTGNMVNRSVNLRVPNGQNLMLLGGNVTLEGGILQAPGGRVELGGLAAAGRVELVTSGNELQLQFPDGVERSNISLSDSSLSFSAVNVAAGGGGSIVINARNLDILDSSFLQAGIRPGLGTVTSQAGDITLNATGVLQIQGMSGVFNLVQAGATGNAGNTLINVGSLNVTNGAQLTSDVFGRGNGGNISITVRDTAIFDGADSNGFSSSVGSQVAPNAMGNGGTLTLIVGSLRVTNGAQLNSSTFGQGNAGNIWISVRDIAIFDGVGTNGFSSDAESTVEAGAVGQGGSLTLFAGSLNVTNGAVLGSGTFGQGSAGTVSIIIRDAATFDGTGSNGFSSIVRSQVGPKAVGQGGTLTLSADSLRVTNGAQLSSSTFGQGNAGNIWITVRDIAIFDGTGSNEFSSGVRSQVGPKAVGQGGTLTLSADSLRVTNGAQLSSSTFGQGDAGNIWITVRDIAIFDGVGINGFSSGAASTLETGAVGQGGG